MEERIETSRRSGRIINDPELLAMADIAQTMEGLSNIARWRVVQWASSRYASGMQINLPDAPNNPREPNDGPSFDE